MILSSLAKDCLSGSCWHNSRNMIKGAYENNKKTISQDSRLFPVQHGNVIYSNLKVLNAMLYALENGGKWRQLPKKYGKWNSIYKRVNRWVKDGVLKRIFELLHAEQITELTIDALGLDSMVIKVHPDGCGAEKETGNNGSDTGSLACLSRRYQYH